MTEHIMKELKDLGLQREVMEALPYAVVGGAYMASMEVDIAANEYVTALNHVVPAGHQLKILFLRVWTQNTGGAKFSIEQTNPTEAGQTGTLVEAYPVVGSVPSGTRDYPMLEAAGAEVLRGGLVNPVHVLEGSIEFRIHGPIDADSDKYGVVFWGCEKVPE